MKSIKLIDSFDTGHHYIYQKNLNIIKETKIKNEIVKFTDFKKKPFLAIKERKKFILKMQKKANKDDILHFLYIDALYKIPIKKMKNKCIGTLHWIPKNKISRILLRNFCRKINYVVVHSKYLELKLKQMGINNVICIDYPSFIDNKVEEKNINKSNIILSCLGGTRKDKGLDILMESFKYINESVKSKLIFNIAGIEQDVKYSDLIQKAKENNINIKINNSFLTDEEYKKEIRQSDVILLPYRKIFSGNSGPMTDGIFMNKFILGPCEGNLGFLINEYDLGDTFEGENPVDLAKKISDLVDIDLKKEHKYREELTVERFIEKHKILYDKVAKGL